MVGANHLVRCCPALFVPAEERVCPGDLPDEPRGEAVAGQVRDVLIIPFPLLNVHLALFLRRVYTAVYKSIQHLVGR